MTLEANIANCINDYNITYIFITIPNTQDFGTVAM
jgi:hypothetical protein